MIIFAPHDIDIEQDQKRYQLIKKYMHKNGAPQIKAIWCGDHYRAIEGSMRLYIAAELNLTPEIIEIEGNEIIEHDTETDEIPQKIRAIKYAEWLESMVAYEFELEK